MSVGGRRYGLQGRYCFVCFFRPPDERKNPDWSDLMNYLIQPCDWSPETIKVFSHYLFSKRRINQEIVSNLFIIR